MPTITQLEYILAVDTHRHFGEAARQCYVTQPTLSMQIQKAEQALNILIFDRNKHPVAPTDIGKQLIAQARIILREAKKLKQLVLEFKGEISGVLQIGIIPTLAPYLLPKFIGNFAKKYPNLSLSIQEIPTNEIIKKLHNDTLDLGILVTPLHDKRIQEIPLFYEEIKLYVHPKHPFYNSMEIASEKLKDQGVWLLQQGHCFRSQVLNLCSLQDSPNQTKQQLPFWYESSSLEAIRRLVDQEGGFTLLPELAIEDTLKAHIRPINTHPLREVSLVHVNNFAKTKIVKLLAKHIEAHIPDYMQDKERGGIVEWK